MSASKNSTPEATRPASSGGHNFKKPKRPPLPHLTPLTPIAEDISPLDLDDRLSLSPEAKRFLEERSSKPPKKSDDEDFSLGGIDGVDWNDIPAEDRAEINSLMEDTKQGERMKARNRQEVRHVVEDILESRGLRKRRRGEVQDNDPSNRVENNVDIAGGKDRGEGRCAC